MLLPVVSPAKQFQSSEPDTEAHPPDALPLTKQCPTYRGRHRASGQSDAAELAGESPETGRTSANVEEI